MIEIVKRGGIEIARCTECKREWYAAENVKHTHEEQEPMKCPKCEAPIPPTPHKNHHCYRCGEPHPAIAQNEAAQRLAQLGGDSSNTASVTFGAAFTSEPGCNVRPKCTCPPTHRIATCELHGRLVREREIKAIVDPTTNAIEAIARERDELRATVKGMKEAIAPAVIEQAARNERSALAARHVALERADRKERENDNLHAFRRSILAALGMPENGDAISKVRGLMSHDRTDVLERDLAGVREQLDITRRKLEEKHHTIDQALPTICEITKRVDIPWPCTDRKGHANHSAIAAVECLADRYSSARAEMARLCGVIDQREVEIARISSLFGEQKGTIERIADDLKNAYAYQARTQTALEGFVSACADQTIQIMELRGALREVKPDHPLFGTSAQIPDAKPPG